MSFIKDNGGILVVLGVVAVLLGAYNEWRISVAVSNQFEAAGLVKPAAVEANAESIEDLEKLHGKDIDRVQDMTTRIAQILMEE